MPARAPFEYTVVRIVPRVEREEFINVGVILYCKAHHFCKARLCLDSERLAALAPDLDAAEIRAHLDLIARISEGDPSAGPLGAMNEGERFRWLASPRSTVVQVSPIHAGLTDDPQAALDDLFERLVK